MILSFVWLGVVDVSHGLWGGGSSPLRDFNAKLGRGGSSHGLGKPFLFPVERWVYLASLDVRVKPLLLVVWLLLVLQGSWSLYLFLGFSFKAFGYPLWVLFVEESVCDNGDLVVLVGRWVSLASCVILGLYIRAFGYPS